MANLLQRLLGFFTGRQAEQEYYDHQQQYDDDEEYDDDQQPPFIGGN